MIGTTAALLTASASLAIAGGPASAATAAGSAGAAVCSTSGVVVVDGFVFNPATVARGQSSAATLAAHNCTGTSQTVSETWYGRFVSATGTGIPAGCPVLDPFLRSVTFGPYAAVTTSTVYSTFAGCTATGLQITVRLTSSTGAALGQATATLNIVAPPAS